MASGDAGPNFTRRGAMAGAAALAALPAAARPVKDAIVGVWTGAAELPGDHMAFSVDVARDEVGKLAATIDILDSGVVRLALRDVAVEGDRARFTMPYGGGAIPFSARLSGDAMTGTMRFGETSAPFTLSRRPPPPRRYREEPITLGDAHLHGTVLTPLGPGPHPAMVFQHSGRLETRQPWLFWADHFASRGVAGVVWDNRGSNGSTGGRWADFADVAADGAAAVRLLRGRRDIDPRRIGLFAVSQGGWVAPMVAAADPTIAWVAMVSGPGTSQQRTVLHEARRELESRGFPFAQVAAGVAAKARFEQMILDGAPDDELDTFRAGVATQPWFEHLGLMPRNHWHRGWWRRNAIHDPARYWPRVQAPVLDLYGERDVELSVIDSIAAMETAYRSGGARSLTTRILGGADHSLRTWRGPRPVRVSEAMDVMTAWVMDRARPA